MPERYGPWETAYGLFRAWQRDGVWASVLEKLPDRANAADIITWDVSAGSTVVRADQRAAETAASDGGRQDDHGPGRSAEPRPTD